MKSYLVAATLFASSALAYLPSCQWNDCMLSWDGQTCESDNGWNCLCSNSTAVNQINTCVATSCTNTTDQEAIYGAIAQLCANNGVALTQTQQATFSATSGGSAWPSQFTGSGYGPGGRWNSGNWGDWVSACSTGLPGAPSGWAGGRWGSAPGWGGRGGRGGMSGGPGGYGPWGTKASGINCAAWTTWTAGWGPFSAWTGTWSGCSSTTDAPIPATVTTTVTNNGSVQVLTGTTFGIQAVAAATSGSSASAGSAGAIFLPNGVLYMSAGALAIFAAMVAL